MGEMTSALYIEVNALSIILLIWVLRKLRQSIDKRLENILFEKTALVVDLALVVDIVLKLLEHKQGQFFYTLFCLFEIFYMSLTAIVGYFWMLYVISEYSNYRRKLFRKRNQILMAIPCIILTLLCIVSPFTEWMFTIDKSTLQADIGKLYLIQYFIAYGYFVVSLLVMLFGKIFHQGFIKPRFEISYLYVAMLVVMGILNLHHPGIPAAWPALAFIIMLTYAGILEQQVSLDGLTRLNNRRSFDSFFKAKLNTDVPFALFILDIDKFKTINDNFGHLEGDSAIITTADILRKVCANKNVFLARYGGDEFVIVYVCNSETEAALFKTEIKQAFINDRNEKNRPYNLMTSVGFAFLPASEERNGQALIAKADIMLYREKAIVHSIKTTPEKLWAEFVSKHADVKANYKTHAFDSDSQVALILQGNKTALSSAFKTYEFTNEQLPHENDYTVILNSKNEAFCIIQTTKVSVVPFSKVNQIHITKEAEGNNNLETWQISHRAIFEKELSKYNVPFTEETLIVLEEFKVIYPIQKQQLGHL